MTYDVIGDLHGQHGKLVALLADLGYRETHGAWRHPGRTAVFVGDFIDRGDRQLETLDVVRRMVDAGSAVAAMGNHEFNAIAWGTPHPDGDGRHLRAHSERNRHQHEAFLDAIGDDAHRHRTILDWFLDLPVWLDLDGIRVVHACWDPASMDALAPVLRSGHRLDAELMLQAATRGTTAFAAIETLLKGPEFTLPEGLRVRIGDDERGEVRTRWWDAGANTLPRAAIVPRGAQASLPDTAVPAHLRPGYGDEKPVFIGHYWMTGTPAVLAPRVACVDYSAAKKGPLVAYRWDGEAELDDANFHWVGKPLG